MRASMRTLSVLATVARVGRPQTVGPSCRQVAPGTVNPSRDGTGTGAIRAPCAPRLPGLGRRWFRDAGGVVGTTPLVGERLRLSEDHGGDWVVRERERETRPRYDRL